MNSNMRRAVRLAGAVAVVIAVSFTVMASVAGEVPVPDVSGDWDFVVKERGKLVATGSITVDTQGALNGSGTDFMGTPFTISGSLTQDRKKVNGSIDVAVGGTITYGFTGKANKPGTRMKWKGIETAGPEVGDKIKVIFSRPVMRP